MNNLFTRHCEEAKADEAIQTLSLRLTGLLRSSFKKVHWTFLFATQSTSHRSQ